MEFCSLGSGSAGNALLVRTASACVMVDCGFGRRELERRMALRGMHPRDLDGRFPRPCGLPLGTCSHDQHPDENRRGANRPHGRQDTAPAHLRAAATGRWTGADGPGGECTPGEAVDGPLHLAVGNE